MDYQIIVENESYDLGLKVQEEIIDGWKPQGGVSVVTWIDEDGERQWEYMQAMIYKD